MNSLPVLINILSYGRGGSGGGSGSSSEGGGVTD